MGAYDAEELKIQRQRAIAKALRDSGNVSFDPAASAGRLVYKRSALEDVAKALNQGMGAYADRQGDKLTEALMKRKAADTEAGIQGSMDALVGNSELKIGDKAAPDGVPLQQFDPVALPGTGGPMIGTEQNDKRTALANALRGMDPEKQAALLQSKVIDQSLGQDEFMPVGGTSVFNKKDKTFLQAPQTPVVEKPEKLSNRFMEVVDPSVKEGHRTIRVEDYMAGMQEWQKPATSSGSGPGAGGVEMFSPETLSGIVDEVMADPSAINRHVSRAQAAAPQRRQIDEALTAKLKDIGMTRHELIRARGLAASERKNMDALVKSQSLVDAFDTVARGNGERALELVKGVDVTGVPALEGLIRKGKVKAGSTDAAEFASVIAAYQREVARILAGSPTLAGVITDSANAKMEDILSGSLSAPQLERVVKRLNFEMDLRRHGFDTQIAQAQNAMAPGGAPAPMPVAPVPPSATPTSTAVPAEPHITGPNGEIMVVRGDKWVPYVAK